MAQQILLKTAGIGAAYAFPPASLASGGDVLVTFYADAVVLLVAIIAIPLWKVSFKRKVVTVGGLLIGGVLAWALTWNVPYSANAISITSLHALLPLLGGTLAWWLSRKFDQGRGRV